MNPEHDTLTNCIKKEPVRKSYLLLLSFAIPFFFLLLLFAILRSIAPFGNHTMVLADAKGQYISYFAFYRNLLLGKEDFFYSFSKILGGPVAGLYAYYLASPLNLLLLLFSPAKLPLAIDWLIVLKLSLCGYTLALFFNERHELKPQSLIFTTAYAFCGYNIAYAWCIIWIDAVLCLPLIALGIERLYHQANPVQYIIFLSIGIISCFYTGYMLCFFSVLYFIYLFLEEKQTFCWKPMLLFCFSSLLGGGLSAILLIPGYKVLSGGVPEGIYASISKFTYPAMTFFLKLIFPDLESPDHLIIPALIIVFFLYCGILFFTAYIFLTGKATRVIRFTFLSISIVMLIAWYFLIEIPVHKSVGFSDRWILTKFIIGYVPFWEFFDGSPNVYTGSLSFILVICFFCNKEVPTRRRVASALLLTALICSISFNLINVIWHGFEKNDCFNYRYSFILCFILLFLANNCILNITGLSLLTIISASVFCLAILSSNIFHPIWFFDKKLFLISVLFFLFGTIALLLYRKNSRNSTSLIVFVEFCAILLTAGMSFKNQSYDHGASAEHFFNVFTYDQKPIQEIKQSDSDFYRIRKRGQFYNYNDPLLFDYSGLSHYSSSEKITTIQFLNALGQQTSPYWANGDLGESRALDTLLGVRYYLGDPLQGYENVSGNIQKNANALSLSFQASLSALDITALSDDPAINTNIVFSSLCGEEIEIFSAAESRDGRLIVTKQDMLYFCNDIPQFDGYVLYRNGELIQQNNGLLGKRLVSLGSFDLNDELELSLFDNSGNTISPSAKCLFYYESLSAISNAFELLGASVDEKIETASKIELSFNAPENELIVLTLPEDTGWNVILDGQPSEHIAVFDTLIAIPVTVGNHHIFLRYTPPGLKAGICISFLSLLVLIAYIFTKKTHYGR